MFQSWVKSKIGGLLGGKGRGGRKARGAERFTARNSQASFRWRDGGEKKFTPMKMVNISRSGLLFVADSVPPVDVQVQVRFEDGRRTLVDARVIQVARTARGPHWIRIVFSSPCPDEVLASVVGEPRTRTRTNAAPRGVDAALTLLGLEWPCNLPDVKTAFRLRSKELHPDLGGTAEGFMALREAFDSLLLACQSAPDHTKRREPSSRTLSFM